MSSIERTAYPRFAKGRLLTEQELEKFYSLTPAELNYINENIRGDQMKLNFAVQLKAFQRLGYFPELKTIPSVVTEHIKKCLGMFHDEINFYYKHDTRGPAPMPAKSYQMSGVTKSYSISAISFCISN